MIDLKRLHDDAEYRRGIERKRVQSRLVDEVLKLDDLRRKMIGEVDPLTFLSTLALFGAISLLASWLPAQRAATMDPKTALHEQ